MVKSIGYESVQYQEALAQIARQGIPVRDPKFHGEKVTMLTKPCMITSIKRPPDMKKHERIVSMDGPISRREVKFHTKAPFVQRVFNQFANYPFDKDDILDAFHDLWVSTTEPPRPITNVEPEMDRDLARILSQASKDGSTLVGTNNVIELASWR